MAKKTTITITDISPTTITGGKETGGIITGGVTDVITRGRSYGSRTYNLDEYEKIQEAKRQAEAQRQAEIKRQQAIEKQRADAQKRSQELAQEKAYVQKLQRMSAQQRRQFLINQTNISKAIALQKLQDSGKRLSSSSQIMLSRFKSQLPKIPQNINQKKDFSKIKKSFNIISGGSLTKRDLNKKQEQINKQIEDYNKVFSGRELNELEFRRATQIQEVIDKNQEVIDKSKEKFEKSKTKKFGEFLFGNKEIPIENYEKQINLEKENLNKINSKLNEAKGLNKFRLEKLKQGTQNAITTLEQGKNPYKILMGDAPITPIGTATSLSKVSKIRFLGKQSIKGDKIITDLAFVTDKGKRIGIARGVTLSRGKEGATIVKGRSLRPGFSLLKKKFVGKGLRTFVGVEKSITKPSAFAIKNQIRLLRGKKNINIIKRNIEGLRQISVGMVKQAKGSKILRTAIKFPTGKLFKIKGKGMTQDTFASISAIFTKGDLSKIIGKTITAKGNKADFIGIIKGEKSLGSLEKLSGNQKEQFTKALKKVISTVASAQAETNKLKNIPKIKGASEVVTSLIAKQKIGNISSTKISQIKKTTAIKTKTLNKLKTKTKLIDKQLNKLRQKVQTKQKTKQKIKLATKALQKIKQLQAQRIKIKLAQKQILKSVIPKKSFSIPRISRINLIRFPSIKSKKLKLKLKKAKESVPAFNVYGKSGKKFVKINTKPLKRDDALSKGAYAIDNTTSKQFKIVPAGKRKKVGKLRINERNYFNRAGYKLREYKVRGARKFGIKPKYIEKTKYGIDTRGEKKGLSIAKYLKQSKKTNVKRKITPSRRRQLIQQLKKARKIKMEKLRKK